MAPSSLWTTTAFGLTPGFQPENVPSSLAKRKIAGAPAAILNEPLPLKTVPVGAPGTWIFIGPAGLPSASKIDEVADALFATHHGLVGPAEMPQAFRRSKS